LSARQPWCAVRVSAVLPFRHMEPRVHMLLAVTAFGTSSGVPCEHLVRGACALQATLDTRTPTPMHSAGWSC
jgi:hypothetical protein